MSAVGCLEHVGDRSELMSVLDVFTTATSNTPMLSVATTHAAAETAAHAAAETAAHAAAETAAHAAAETAAHTDAEIAAHAAAETAAHAAAETAAHTDAEIAAHAAAETAAHTDAEIAAHAAAETAAHAAAETAAHTDAETAAHAAAETAALLQPAPTILCVIPNQQQPLCLAIDDIKMPPPIRKRGRPKGAEMTVIGLPKKRKMLTRPVPFLKRSPEEKESSTYFCCMNRQMLYFQVSPGGSLNALVFIKFFSVIMRWFVKAEVAEKAMNGGELISGRAVEKHP